MRILRLPTLREVVGLFVAPATVAGAIAELSKASDRMEAVIAHNMAKGAAARVRHKDLLEAAKFELGLAEGHEAEVDHAVRVTQRLTDLLA